MRILIILLIFKISPLNAQDSLRNNIASNPVIQFKDSIDILSKQTKILNIRLKEESSYYVSKSRKNRKQLDLFLIEKQKSDSLRSLKLLNTMQDALKDSLLKDEKYLFNVSNEINRTSLFEKVEINNKGGELIAKLKYANQIAKSNLEEQAMHHLCQLKLYFKHNQDLVKLLKLPFNNDTIESQMKIVVSNFNKRTHERMSSVFAGNNRLGSESYLAFYHRRKLELLYSKAMIDTIINIEMYKKMSLTSNSNIKDSLLRLGKELEFIHNTYMVLIGDYETIDCGVVDKIFSDLKSINHPKLMKESEELLAVIQCLIDIKHSYNYISQSKHLSKEELASIFQKYPLLYLDVSRVKIYDNCSDKFTCKN